MAADAGTGDPIIGNRLNHGRPHVAAGRIGVQLFDRSGGEIVEPLRNLRGPIHVQPGDHETAGGADPQQHGPADQLGAVVNGDANQRGQQHYDGPAARKRHQSGEQHNGQRGNRQRNLPIELGPGRKRTRHSAAALLLARGMIAQAALNPPDQRPDAERQQVGEMVMVDETSLNAVQSVAIRMLVDPHKLAVAGDKLQDAEGGHDRGQAGDPFDHAFHVAQSTHPLHGNHEQHPVGQINGQSASGRLRRERNLRPHALGGAGFGGGGPQRENLGHPGREHPQQRLAQRNQLQQHEHRTEQQQRLGPGPNPAALGSHQPVRHPGRGGHGPQQHQQQVSPRMPAAHDKGQREHGAGQGAVDDPQRGREGFTAAAAQGGRCRGAVVGWLCFLHASTLMISVGATSGTRSGIRKNSVPRGSIEFLRIQLLLVDRSCLGRGFMRRLLCSRPKSGPRPPRPPRPPRRHSRIRRFRIRSRRNRRSRCPFRHWHG